jgi:circadian clock protein KaiC
MNKSAPPQRATARTFLGKTTPAGIHGLDEIIDGGLPSGWPKLLCGEPGCGKTLLAVEDITGNCHMPPDAAS